VNNNQKKVYDEKSNTQSGGVNEAWTEIKNFTAACCGVFLAYIVFLIFLVFTDDANAEVFAKVDGKGNVTYTNIAPEGQKQKIRKTNLTDEKPVNKPTTKMAVSSTTQKKRDGMRLSILNEELRIEQKNLTLAQKSGDVDSQSMHKRNIDLLQKEIGLTNE